MAFRYLLAFGSNVGNGHAHFRAGIEALREGGVEILAESPRIVTTPLPSNVVDVSDHAPYLNSVCEARSLLAPREFYSLVARVEDAIGHPRTRAWLPRALDIDILLAALEPCVGGSDTSSAQPSSQPFSACVPFFYKGAPVLIAQEPGSVPQRALCIPHVEFSSRLFLQALVVDELRVVEACLVAHGIR